jgi:hypothetical protein
MRRPASERHWPRKHALKKFATRVGENPRSPAKIIGSESEPGSRLTIAGGGGVQHLVRLMGRARAFEPDAWGSRKSPFQANETVSSCTSRFRRTSDCTISSLAKPRLIPNLSCALSPTQSALSRERFSPLVISCHSGDPQAACRGELLHGSEGRRPASRPDAGLLLVLQPYTRTGSHSVSAMWTANAFRSILPIPLRGIWPITRSRSGTL